MTLLIVKQRAGRQRNEGVVGLMVIAGRFFNLD